MFKFEMKAVVLIMVIFLLGCSQQIEEVENVTDSNEFVNDTSIPNESTIVTIEKKIVNIDKEKRQEARGFGLYDFDILNKDNCLDEYNSIKEKTAEISEDINNEKEELEDELRDLRNAEAELEAAQSTGDERIIKRALRDYDTEKDDVEDSEDELEDLEKTKKRFEIIAKETDRICKRLLAGE